MKKILLFLLLFTSNIFSQMNSDVQSITLQLKYKHQFQFAGYYAAVEKGFYKNAGLDVKLLEGKPGQDFVDIVLSEQADYGIELPDLIIKRFAGKPVVVLGAIFQHSPQIIISRADIRTPHDLIGKNIKMNNLDDVCKSMLLSESVDLTLINFIDKPKAVQEFINGELDAISAYITDQPYYLGKQNIRFNILYPQSYGIDFYGDCLFTSEHEIKHHKDRVDAFLHASKQGWVYALAHTDEMIDLIITKYDSTLSYDFLQYEAKIMHDLILPQVVEIGYMNRGRWKSIAETYAKSGIINSNFSIDGFLYEPGQHSELKYLYPALLVLSILVAMGVIIMLFLLYFNKSLKIAVKERTRQVDILNKDLELKIIERTHELQDALRILRKRELALRQSEEQFRGAFESATHGMVMYSIDGKYSLVNKAFCELVGYSEQELLSLHFQSITFDQDLQKDLEQKQSLFDGRLKSYQMEKRYIHKNGHILWVILSVFVVNDSDGIPFQYVGQIIDITDRKNAENQLFKYSEQLKVLLREVNHRVKNNLTAIIGMLHLEDDQAITSGNEQFLLLLQDLKNRINSLLTVHSLLSARGWGMLRISSLCEQVIHSVIQNIPRDKTIELFVAESTLMINSDQAHQLTLVFNELATNTIKYAITEKKSVTIHVNIEMADEEITICYQDDGPGYPEEMLHNPLFRANIGFELIRGIVTYNLNGQVTLANKEGAVTLISFKLDN